MADDTYAKLHPILNEITQTYVDLYTSQPDEKNRERLIKLEALLREKLDTLEKVRNGKNG